MPPKPQRFYAARFEASILHLVPDSLWALARPASGWQGRGLVYFAFLAGAGTTDTAMASE